MRFNNHKFKAQCKLVYSWALQGEKDDEQIFFDRNYFSNISFLR